MKTNKKIWLLVAVLAVLGIFLVGCGSKSKLPEGFEESKVKAQAEEDIKIAEADDYEGWRDRFAAELKEQLTEDSYKAYLGILEEKGGFKEFGKTAFVGQEKDGKKYAAVVYVVKHENGDIKYTVGYDEDMNLVQFLAQ